MCGNYQPLQGRLQVQGKWQDKSRLAGEDVDLSETTDRAANKRGTLSTPAAAPRGSALSNGAFLDDSRAVDIQTQASIPRNATPPSRSHRAIARVPSDWLVPR